jgi:L-fuculose-phosphate aldolase
MLLEEERLELVVYGKRMLADRLVTLTSGNISIYDSETGYMAVTPSGIPYDETTPQDIVIMTLDGKMSMGAGSLQAKTGCMQLCTRRGHTHGRLSIRTRCLRQPSASQGKK